MKRLTMICVSAIALVCASSGAAPAKSRADLERAAADKQRAETASHKVAEAEKMRLWKDDPKGFFATYIQDSYGFENGRPRLLIKMKCTIVQILNDTEFLGVRPARQENGEFLDGELFHGQDCNLCGQVDGEEITVAVAYEKKYTYTTVLGGSKTVRSYRSLPGITFDQYMSASRTMRFAEEPSDPARKKLPLIY